VEEHEKALKESAAILAKVEEHGSLYIELKAVVASV